ncbi:lachesin-like [Limulus polyphemus]|uniref:Lachesin-like n=1 Tax=Limulus polyphemus TaxID=6850 RepID=A0ABM1TJY5_LIMPO|nr:lachesin-like [Limulus polyphemus]
MYDWILLSFLAALQVLQLCTLPITSSPRFKHVNPDLVEVSCKEGKNIVLGTWLRHQSTVNGGLIPNPKSVAAKGDSCCSLCFSTVRKDSSVCVLTEGNNITYIVQILLRVTILSQPTTSSLTHRVTACHGSDIYLICNVESSSLVSIKWRRKWDHLIFHGQSLLISGAQREDEGIYSCEAEDDRGHIVKRDVILLVQTLPLNSVPNSEVNVTIEADWILRCIVERFPVPDVLWFKDNTTFDEKVYPYYNISIEKTENCTVFATLKAIPSFTTEAINNTSYENYTCEATNKYGTVLAYLQLTDVNGVTSNVTVRNTEEKTKPNKFNVTGFIVGMLPPLFISFYIILKLGNRSRYAEERAEEQGIREEPFFVSY